MKIKINADDDLPLGKKLSTQNAIILFGTIFSNNYNCYHHSVRLVK